MSPARIDIEALVAMAKWPSEKTYRNALDEREARTNITPRTAKIGGRYAFAIVDVLDAAYARPLIARGVTVAAAFEKVRPRMNQLFVHRPKRDANPKLLRAQAEGRFFEAHFDSAEQLTDLRIMDRPDLVFDGPRDSAVRWSFSKNAVLLFPIIHRIEMVLEEAVRRGLDLTNIEHGEIK